MVRLGGEADLMRIVWVTPYVPDRSGGGGQIRQAHLLAGLAGHHEVTLVSPGPVTDPHVVGAVTAIEVAPPSPNWLDRGLTGRRFGDLWGILGSRRPREERAEAPLRDALAWTLALLDADVVLIEFAGLAPLIRHPALAPLRSRSRWVLTLHNLPSRMARHQAAAATGRRQRWLWEREAAIATDGEREAVRLYDDVVVTSEADRLRLPATAPVSVIGNGVDLDRFRPSPVPDEPRAVLTGALYTSPNTDGAVWLCQDVLPLVRRRIPEVAVDLVGARPPPAVRALGRLPGVRILADVDDVAPHLRRARVATVPLRIGSGTRLKAMEAWAAGRPVVGTTLGLEGLGALPGHHALVADDTEAFAGALTRLLDRANDDLVDRLAGAGRQLVEADLGWPVPADRLRSLVERGGGREGRS